MRSSHSVEQNLAYQTRLRGHSGGREMDDALERVGLGGFRKRRAGGLSLGQEKRLAIAGAIMGEPELVVLDEPLSGLDPMGVRSMLAMLQELASSGQTLIVTSHRLHERTYETWSLQMTSTGELLPSWPFLTRGYLTYPSS